jgi:RNA polymerase sigma-70 factor (ECF subfamily)
MPKPGIVVSMDRIRKARPASIRDALLAHLDELYRFALHMTAHAERARDVVHESVLRALEHESTVVRNPRAWLFQIVYHTFISQYRKDERRGRSYEDLRGDEPGPENLRDPLPSLIASEDVREAVEKLPEEFRAVVWLSDAEQLRLREIAELLGCPLGTVASRLSRGRQELRRLLSAYGPQGEK